MLQYSQGTTATLYVNFLTIEGKEATTVVNPVITIRHINAANTLVVDVNEATLVFATETLFYFKWAIPAAQDLGEYTVEYEATVDGEYAEANETIQITPMLGSVLAPCDDYTTAQTVADYLGVDVANIKDEWIDWATAYITTFTCQRFCPTIVTEKYDIDESHQETLMLDNYPILNVIELKDDGVALLTSDFLIYEDEGFIKLVDDFTGSSNILQPGPFTFGRQKVEIAYTYGYIQVPKDIEWAATVLSASIASTALKQSGTISGGAVIEEEIGEYRVRRSEDQTTSTTFDLNVEGSKNIDDRLEEDVFSAKNVLRMYRDRKMRAV